MSCEPTWTSAYSEDLRWRMIWQSELLGYSQQPIAQNLGVDQSTVSRTIQLFETTGSVGKKPNPKERSFRKLTAPCQLLHLVLQHPGIHYICTTAKLLSRDRADVRNFRFLPQYARSSQSTVLSWRQSIRHIVVTGLFGGLVGRWCC